MYLLDTNACIALIKGTFPSVRARFDKAILAQAQVLVSSVVAFELWYGVGKSERPDTNAKRLEAFFSGPIRLLAFEPEDARVAGRLRAILEATGKPIGAYDVMIAGQALRHRLTSVTANVREFSRIKDLEWEDWGKT